MFNKKIARKNLKAHFDRHNVTAATTSTHDFGKKVVGGKGGITVNAAIPDSIFARELSDALAESIDADAE